MHVHEKVDTAQLHKAVKDITGINNIASNTRPFCFPNIFKQHNNSLQSDVWLFETDEVK